GSIFRRRGRGDGHHGAHGAQVCQPSPGLHPAKARRLLSGGSRTEHEVMTMRARYMDEERMQRLREASEWMVHLGSEECSADDTAAWLRWCDASPENLQAFQSLQRDWRDLDALKGIQPASAAMAGVSHSARW